MLETSLFSAAFMRWIMPIYTYRCENCGVQFERQQKFSDQPLSWCPECSKRALRKVYTPVGIVFKGSGFYSTDNRTSSGANRPTSSSKSDMEKSESSQKSESSEKKTENTDKSSSSKKD
jgi:putative FmdB family regulatory protein